MASGVEGFAEVRDTSVDGVFRLAHRTPDILVAYRAGVEALLRRAQEVGVLSEVRSLEFEASIRSRSALALSMAAWGQLRASQLDTLRELVAAMDNGDGSFRRIVSMIWQEEAALRGLNLYASGEGIFVRDASWPMADQGRDPDQTEEEEDEEGEGESESGSEEEEESSRGEGEDESESESSSEEDSDSDSDSASEAGTAGSGAGADRSKPWVCHLCPQHRYTVKSSLARHLREKHDIYGFVPRPQ